MKNQYNYSVIIPHKNTTNLLLRSISSIPFRDDIQIIVIDDNSDNFDKKEFVNKLKSNVEIDFTTEGKGAGYARNIGLQKAKGKWILFLDADDNFLPNSFENTIDKHIDTDADIVYFGATSIFSDTGKPAERHQGIMSQLKRYKNNNKATENELKYSIVNPYCKLIRNSLVQKYNIKFDEVMYSNDIMFSMYIAYYSKSIKVDITPIYCINVVAGSLIQRVSTQSIKCRFIVNLRKNQFLRSINQQQYQVSIMNHLFFAFKKGPSVFYQFLKIAIHYNANPFIGYNRWLKTISRKYKARETERKYKVYD